MILRSVAREGSREFGHNDAGLGPVMQSQLGPPPDVISTQQYTALLLKGARVGWRQPAGHVLTYELVDTCLLGLGDLPSLPTWCEP